MTYPERKDWTRFHGTFNADPKKKVVGVDFQIEAKDAVSSTTGIDRKPIHFTDIQFQAGNQLTGWIPNTKEMLERLTWTHDEFEAVPSNSSFMGAPPKVYEDVNFRWYNIVGRGHKTIIVPNYLPEDWDVEILPTGLDITLYPKEDYDALRVSTSVGVELPEEKQRYKLKGKGAFYDEIKQKYEEVTSEHYSGSEARKKQEISNWVNIMKPLLDKHPLHTRYTREFWVDGAKAGTEIKIHATTREASVGGEEIKIVGEDRIMINGSPLYIDRKKFMLAPKGTAAFRVEFYKQVEKPFITYDITKHGNEVRTQKVLKYMEDVGIGYYGTAGFVQWTHGRSKI